MWQGGLACDKQSILHICYGGNYCVISPFYFGLSLHSVTNTLFLPHPCSGGTFHFPIGPIQGLEQECPGFGDRAINRAGGC